MYRSDENDSTAHPDDLSIEHTHHDVACCSSGLGYQYSVVCPVVLTVLHNRMMFRGRGIFNGVRYNQQTVFLPWWSSEDRTHIQHPYHQSEHKDFFFYSFPFLLHLNPPTTIFFLLQNSSGLNHSHHPSIPSFTFTSWTIDLLFNC